MDDFEYEIVSFGCNSNWVFIVCRINSRRKVGSKIGKGVSKPVSKMFSRFKSVFYERLSELKQHQLKRRTFAKIMWTVNACCDWRSEKMKNVLNFDVKIFEGDLDRVDIELN